MEEHQMMIGQQMVTYTVAFKKMKNIRMRVRNGKLWISAPYHTSLHFIEENIMRYHKQLLAQMKSYVPYAVYENHGYVMIFHQTYELVWRDMGVMKCQQHGHRLYVYHRCIQQCVEQYLKQQLFDYIAQRIDVYLKKDFVMSPPIIEIKKYQSRWGSCYYRENKVSFHLGLIHLEKDLIDYVIVHELSHFLQANHSALFYQEIQKRMPDFREREKRLKEKHT